MILACDNLRVALVTTHTPISQVANEITESKILNKIRLLNKSLQEDFNIIRPLIT